ncbi:FG-GAP repeat protein [Candidatus Sumerlaeota bacterium]|nr:FG-GAP repeat protein [Candidatus Sumerlaeota bacterium]
MKSLIKMVSFMTILFLCIMIACGEVKSDQENPPELMNSNWFGEASHAIQKMEYKASFQRRCQIPGSSCAYHMANRAQGLRVYFFPNSIKIIRRTDPKPCWILELGIVSEDTAATTTIHENVLFRKRREIVEKFLNDESGIHQEIVMEKNVSGFSPLSLNISIKGGLTPRKIGNSVEFLKDNKPVVIYGEFQAFDKKGTPLSLDWELEKESVEILINAKGAVFPVSVKNLIYAPSTVPDKILYLEQDFDGLGWSVGTAGDVNGDGYSDVIVGAPFFDNGDTREGAAFLYYGYPSGLSQYPAWKGESNQAWSAYGKSVSTAGDVNGDGFWDVAIGIPDWDKVTWNDNTGSVQVFYGSSLGLKETPDWVKIGALENDIFGHSVACAGDVNGDGYSDLIVGVPYGGDIYKSQGAALVFHGSSGGLSEIPSWSAEPSEEAVECFGQCVASAGDVNADGFDDVIIGCPEYWYEEYKVGAAYVHFGSEEGLSVIPDWFAQCYGQPAHFGFSVASAGDVNGDGYGDVIVGAPNHKGEYQWAHGRAFIYYGKADGLNTSAAWEYTPETDDANPRYGDSVACAGDVNGDGYSDVIVGMPGERRGLQTDMGKAFIYLGSAQGPSDEPAWEVGPTMTNPPKNAYFGYSVATAGDVNGDGYSDVIVGAPYEAKIGTGEDQIASEGYAYVYYGGPGRLNDNEPDWGVQSNQAGSNLGVSVATAGDVNGDGYADVIVGAPYYDNGEQDEGVVLVWYGYYTGLPPSAGWFAEGNQIGAYFGHSAACAGDVNGDGYDDIIVGAPHASTGFSLEGRAFVWYGSSSGLGENDIAVYADWKYSGGQAGAILGTSVASAGDVNGDGYCDVIVGAPGYNSNTLMDNGVAYVFHGTSGGLSASSSWSATGDKGDALFGFSVSSAGDVNRDGYSDVVVGAPFYSPTGNDWDAQKGTARAYYGSAGGLNASFEWTDRGSAKNAHFGYSVSGAGDLDGDGYSDLVIGEPGANSGEGVAKLYFGSINGLVSFSGGDITIFFEPAAGLLGYSVGCAGDIRNIGKSAVIIGSPCSDGEGAEGSNRGSILALWGFQPEGGGYSLWYHHGSVDSGAFGWSVGCAGDVNGDGYAEILVGSPVFNDGETGEGSAFLFYGNGVKGIPMIPRQLKMDGATPIAHLGKSDEPDQFRISLLARTPFGRGKVKMEMEVKGLTQVFTGNGLFRTGSWQDTGITGSTYNQAFIDFIQGRIYHWRTRVKYKPGNIYGLVHSRWVTIPWNGWNEMDFRTSGNFTLAGNCWIIY